MFPFCSVKDLTSISNCLSLSYVIKSSGSVFSFLSKLYINFGNDSYKNPRLSNVSLTNNFDILPLLLFFPQNSFKYFRIKIYILF